jgi:hypothetical protein
LTNWTEPKSFVTVLEKHREIPRLTRDSTRIGVDEQQTETIGLDLDATRREFETGTRRTGAGNAVTKGEKVKLPKLRGSISWAAFCCQFQTVVSRNHWTCREKYTHVLAVLQLQAVDFSHSVRVGAACKDIVGALKGLYGD